jgi:hypothetical protein
MTGFLPVGDASRRLSPAKRIATGSKNAPPRTSFRTILQSRHRGFQPLRLSRSFEISNSGIMAYVVPSASPLPDKPLTVGFQQHEEIK